MRGVRGRNLIAVEGNYPRQKKRYYKMLELGKCVNCGKETIAKTVLCERCRTNVLDRRSASRLCAICGIENPPKGRRNCDTCMRSTCIECGSIFRRRKNSNPWKYCSVACQSRASRNFTGPLARNWQGGKIAEKRVIRERLDYREWRQAVFKRDAFRCRHCGVTSSKGKTSGLQAHHVKEFSKYPELRVELSNGLTLCESCHREAHRRK